jgi:flagellar hook protein FlgE
MSSFSTALSGLLANTAALDVVGDNLANMNTQGFKSNNILFEDAMQQASQSLQIGDGVGSTSTVRDFTQGTIQTTNGPTDAAIQGNGFFVVTDPSGDTEYTRDGSFSLNSAGQLVTSNGDMVQGWMATNGVVNPNGATTAITVPLLSAQPPVTTTAMSIDANLSANAAVGDTFSTPVQVIDSLGNSQTVTVTYTNTAAGAWSYTATIPGTAVVGGQVGTPSTIGTGNITFDANGNLATPAPPGAETLTNTAALADGAATMNISWNLYDSSGNPTLTGFAQASATAGTTQNGTAASTVTGVSLQDGGTLVATYSNGNQTTLAQVAVASVQNPTTLIANSDNTYSLGTGTLTPSVGASGTSGRGNIVGGALEASNVDMATQLTDLIVFQQGYEANSKVLTTIDQMDQSLLAINV